MILDGFVSVSMCSLADGPLLDIGRGVTIRARFAEMSWADLSLQTDIALMYRSASTELSNQQSAS